MLVALPLFLALPFLALGCIAFLVCACASPLRRFALSASLFFVVCIPIVFAEGAIILFASMGASALNATLDSELPPSMHPSWGNHPWQSLALAVTALTVLIAAASAITLLHGWFTRRMTFALFRFYASGVAAGVGVLIALFLWLWIGVATYQYGVALLGVEIVVLAAFCSITLMRYVYQRAAEFRGAYPERFPFTTRDEFERPVS